MTYPYDDLQIEDLRHEGSQKWTLYPPDVLPLWVADMDFPVAPELLEALHARLSRSIGYPVMAGDPALLDLLIEKQAGRGVGNLTRDSIKLLPGVVPGLYASVLALTSPGDEVITHTPVYPPFLTAISDHGRIPRHAPLSQTAHGWEIDWDTLEAAVTPAARVLLLCSPHNPTGRVWTRAELGRLADFALRHRLWVVADELHADLVLEGEFIPFASLSPQVAARTLTLTGPCKTYNTAGLGIGAAISANPQLLARFGAASLGVMGHPSALSQEMWKAGLTAGSRWLAEILDLLRGNRDFLTGFLAQHLPEVRYVPPQATYLAWLDFRALPWAPQAHAHLLERAKVGLNDGPPFGPDSAGFLRLNFATPRPVLREALERIARMSKSVRSMS